MKMIITPNKFAILIEETVKTKTNANSNQYALAA